MKKEKRVFVVNGEEMVGTILEETESFHIIGFLDYQRGKNLCYEEYNYMKPDGTFLNKEGFVDANSFKDCIADITINCKLDKNGNIII